MAEFEPWGIADGHLEHVVGKVFEAVLVEERAFAAYRVSRCLAAESEKLLACQSVFL